MDNFRVRCRRNLGSRNSSVWGGQKRLMRSDRKLVKPKEKKGTERIAALGALQAVICHPGSETESYRRHKLTLELLNSVLAALRAECFWDVYSFWKLSAEEVGSGWIGSSGQTLSACCFLSLLLSIRLRELVNSAAVMAPICKSSVLSDVWVAVIFL